MTKISQLPSYTAAIAADLIAVVDNTNTITKRMTMNDMSAIIQTLIMPSGIIIETAAVSAPNGWLICDGSAISRTTYAALFTALSTTYGAGDGSTTFNIPDLRGKTAFGRLTADVDFGTLGQTGGQKDVKLHSHYISGAAWDDGNFSGHGGNTQEWGLYADGGTYSSADPNHSYGRNSATTGTGSTNLNPYLTLNYIIKT